MTRPRLRTTLLVGALTVLGATAAVVVTDIASADTTICDQYSSAVAGQYVVQNNRWGTSATQCISVTSNGFRIIQQDGVSNSGAPVSYPSIFYGCHYTNCSPGTVLPKQLSTIGSVNSSIGFTYVNNAKFDASYDIWLDPTAKKDGVNQTEIMIWFNRTGGVQPVGSATASVTIGGRSWQVWTGNNGTNNVVSYVASATLSSWSFSVLDFINDTKNRGYANNSWYLTSIQAGFEPWSGGVGLAVNSFSASVGGGNNSQSSGGNSSSSGGPVGACRITYTPNTWTGGFTANVTAANTGSGAINGWAVAFTLPSGQSITSSWNATLSGNSGSVTARNMSYNASIPAGGSQSFGFQGTYSGTFSRPSSFSLNGTACSIA